MYVVRNVFRARPGKAGELAAKFKAASPFMAQTGTVTATRVMTDAVAGFWNVVVESETEDLNAYLDFATMVSNNPQIGEALKGYHELAEGGHREVFRVV